MKEFSDRLTDARSRLFDAEALLHHLHKPENLNNLLENDSPEVTLGAMIDKAWELVSEASGDCEAMCDTHDEQVKAEIQKTAAEFVSYQREHSSMDAAETTETANAHLMNPVDDLAMIHSQTRAMLVMMMVYLEQADDEGEQLSELILGNYVGQMISNMDHAEQATMKLIQR